MRFGLGLGLGQGLRSLGLIRANFRVSMIRVKLRLRAKIGFKVGQP